MNEAPIFGEKIDIDKINHLKMEFFELEAENENSSIEGRIQNAKRFIENKKASLTIEEIKELSNLIIPKGRVENKSRDRNTFETRRERRNYIN